MGLRSAVVICVLLGAAAAEAGPHKMFMLRADSTTDWATRSHVERTVLGLARNVDRGVARGDTTFADIALSVGCSKGLDSCKREVLDALMIDELVVVTIAPIGDDKVKVTVQRASKAHVREASVTTDKADPDKALLASIGPLFGAHKIVGEPTPASPPPPPSKGTMTTGTVTVDNEPPPERKAVSSEPRPAPETKAAPEPKSAPEPKPQPAPASPLSPVASTEPAPASATVTAAPDNVVRDDGGDPKRPFYIGGMAAGGALAIVGVVLWEKARGIESDARAAPNRTSADIQNLLALESSGDHYALAGNITFFGGLAVAGVSGYLWWNSRSAAHVAPMAVDHGGGVAFSMEVP